jgi:hypothetical protein
MYTWFWRSLPGPLPVRVLLALLAFAAVTVLLFFVVFPAVEPMLPFSDVTVDDQP